ncbi:VOC family protein [Labedella phragmitis]|uniref:VOC family protein n=1 Tax=Labedella phragmitis TaxID=2498849 RepID=A0A3S5CFD4_9MICO|nr:VOC family protein [Labedella phragmitis]RWZ52759.1 VOC family protein [Labedella phragmitis]
MDWTLELVTVPVADLDRAIAFYRDQVGFALDHEIRNDWMEAAQLTPRGSGCSILLDARPGDDKMTAGSARGLQLVVADAYAAREQLVSRDVEADEISVIDPRDGGTLFGFRDPDGNAWVVQQIAARAEKPLLPRD